MMNFLVFWLCVVCAILQGYDGNVGLMIMEIVLALLNLPFAIKWMFKDFKW